MDLKLKIREIPDWPIEGVSFKDITTLLQDGRTFQYIINKLVEPFLEEKYDKEYGPDVLAMHKDTVKKGERISIVDDLIATGGTVEAAVKLLD